MTSRYVQYENFMLYDSMTLKPVKDVHLPILTTVTRTHSSLLYTILSQYHPPSTLWVSFPKLHLSVLLTTLSDLASGHLPVHQVWRDWLSVNNCINIYAQLFCFVMFYRLISENSLIQEMWYSAYTLYNSLSRHHIHCYMYIHSWMQM